MSVAAGTEITRHTLAKESELRAEVDAAGTACVKLISGNAEVFGVELAEGRTYTFSPGRKFAVYTWYGAEIQVWGSLASSYVSAETAMPLYANLHQRLEARREEARATGGQGPRVLVAGPSDSGKSSLCRVLCAYACRLGRAPTFVDLDIGQGEVSLPGTLAATPVERSALSVEDEAGCAKPSPLAFFFGHASPGEYMDVLRNAQGRLADCVNRRLVADAAAGSSGVVVNTMGWVDGGGYDLLLEAVRAFRADVVLVLGSDKLFARLSEDVKALRFAAAPAPADGGVQPLTAVASSTAPAPGAPGQLTAVVAVVKLPRSGGVAERSREARQAARKARVHEYFYGPPRGPGLPPALSPHSTTVGFDDVFVVRVGGVTSEAGLLPIGRASTLDPLRVTAVVPGPALLNHVLAVSFAGSEAAVPHTNVAGFVHVTGVDVERRTLTLLVPCAGPLPSRFLVAGSVAWAE